ncbi:hypothetical protein JRO89_XSUnG0244100 [Xanthoceras sorbifolium]|uniref:Protein N-terminal glutamine amidohydrolase n=1 Tax=Xanthoceras sorbifolium TaxID=99658 RepID=A0ABQ8GWQ1_9ROSI|nr:hypothetical protein JRO89_XSUnG0244100 [Xanthoceras sorbifolium]
MEVSNSKYSSEFDHTPFYCEENVYLLCKKLCAKGVADADGSDLFVVFISNEKKQACIKRADGITLWDYHVVCIQRKRDGDSSCLVWDLDSSLPFPSPLASYVSETIRPSFPVFSEFQRFFRMVHAPIFLRFFASDRRHMKDPAGNWIAEPPSYEPIVAEGKHYDLVEILAVNFKAVICSNHCIATAQNIMRNKLVDCFNHIIDLKCFFRTVEA